MPTKQQHSPIHETSLDPQDITSHFNRTLPTARRAVASAVRRAGHQETAIKITRCRESKWLYFCTECQEIEYRTFFCHHRACPACAKERSSERAKGIAEALSEAKLRDYPKSPLKWITLTMPRSKSLGEGVERIKKAFEKWRRMLKIKKRLWGGIYQIEVVPKENKKWHVHLHLLANSAYISKKLLWKTWARALRVPSVSVNIQAVRSTKKIQSYLTKYVCKPADSSKWSPKHLDEFLSDLHKRRLFGSFGTLYNVVSKAEVESKPCPNCGSLKTMIPWELGALVYGKDWHDIKNAIRGPCEVWVHEFGDG